MHLIKSSKVKLLLCSLISLNLFASNEAFDEKIISEKRLKDIELSREQIKEDSDKWFKESHDKQERAHKLLYKLLEFYIRRWWD